MESGRPVTPTSNETSEEMRNLIEQINMRFQGGTKYEFNAQSNKYKFYKDI